MAKTSSKTKSSRRNRAAQALATTEQAPQRAKSAKLRAVESWQRQEVSPLKCLNAKQALFVDLLRSKQIVLGLGVAGVGKTYLSMKYAAQELDARRIERIVVVRPIIEAGGGLGFLPGDESQKTAPYQIPFLEVLEEHYGKTHVESLLYGKFPRVVFVPPEFIRGRTFKNALVVLDEAQNLSCAQMKTFLTRLGEDTQCIIQGDVEQVDIKTRSGLLDALEILEGLEQVGVVEFTEEDVVRSGLVKDILMRYRHRKVFEK